MECQEIARHVSNPKEMFRKIKKIAGERSTPASNCNKAANGIVLRDPKDVGQR